MKWTLLFILFVILLIVDLFIIDPLPVIDELLLLLGAYLTGRKIGSD
tara:strand:- start:308 stop:448 length:141 start_codon:yes stop_codon:yes gene_type:complete